MKKVAVLTSGGDAPGMNAAIRSVVRYGIEKGLEVFGVIGGYRGLIDGNFVSLELRSVSNIIQRGGTILRTSRCKRFKTKEGIQKAKESLEKNAISGLIVIGGDGSFRGALSLSNVWKGQIIGVPGTIDNDLYGTDKTIGFDTAINTATNAIDKIRDTAESHERFFFVEVMGHNSGFIAQQVGIASGAEEVLVPEYQVNIDEVCSRLCQGKKEGKTSNIAVVAEGSLKEGVYQTVEKLKETYGDCFRVTVLGHLLRGGTPSCADRVLATKLGAFAIDSLLKGETLKMVGKIQGKLVTTHLDQVVANKKSLDPMLSQLQPILAK